MPKPPRHLVRALIAAAVLAGIALVTWLELQPDGYGDGFASGNGRIEATEINIATKLGGRIARILVDDVEVGPRHVEEEVHLVDAASLRVRQDLEIQRVTRAGGERTRGQLDAEQRIHAFNAEDTRSLRQH